ncbi:DMT family transporter [Peptoniphilus sp. GNH]|nr:DMT family transporter [Peptoniphilus sp. GNH]
MNKKTLAYILTIIQTIIVALSVVFVKIALEMTNAYDQLTFRFFLALISVFLVNPFMKNKFKLSKQMFKDLMPLAIFFPVLFLLLQGLGLMYSSATEAGIIQALSPIFAIILSSIMLGEKTNFIQKICIVLSVLGVVYMTYMGSKISISFNPKGTLLLLLSSFVLSFNIVLPRKLKDKYDSHEMTSFITLIGFVVFSLISIFYHMKNADAFNFMLLANPKFFLAMFMLGCIATYFTSWTNNFSLAHLEVSKVSVFTNLCPIISLLGAMAFLGEAVHSYHIIGMIITLVGVIGTNYFANK